MTKRMCNVTYAITVLTCVTNIVDSTSLLEYFVCSLKSLNSSYCMIGMQLELLCTHFNVILNQGS